MGLCVVGCRVVVLGDDDDDGEGADDGPDEGAAPGDDDGDGV